MFKKVTIYVVRLGNDDEIRESAPCINCTNMTESLLCAKHNVEVEANNVCGDHQVKG